MTFIGKFLVIILLLSATFLKAQQLSKQEKRALRKKERVLLQHQKIITASKDTLFSLHIPSMLERTHYGKDESVINFSKSILTLYNVVMPVTDDEHAEKVPSEITRLRHYKIHESESGNLTITSRFLYSKWMYTLVIEKVQESPKAIIRFYIRGDLLKSYEGKIRT